MLIANKMLRDKNQKVLTSEKKVLLYTSPVNSTTPGVSRHKVGLLETEPLFPVLEIVLCQRTVYFLRRG